MQIIFIFYISITMQRFSVKCEPSGNYTYHLLLSN
jgi:hypothetical protein